MLDGGFEYPLEFSPLESVIRVGMGVRDMMFINGVKRIEVVFRFLSSEEGDADVFCDSDAIGTPFIKSMYI